MASALEARADVIEATTTDLAHNAPEYDNTAETAQVVFGAGAEIAYDKTSPEANLGPIEASTEPLSSRTQSPKLHALSRKVFWTLLFTAALILVGGSIGAGLGIGLRTRVHDSVAASTTTSLPISHTSTSALATSTPISIEHAVLNGTSLAAVTTSEGNRHVFFQEQSGTIRQCIFTLSNGRWSAPTNYIVTTDAKLYTPMSAIQVPAKKSHLQTETIYLFYVVSNNSVAFKEFPFKDAAWSNGYYDLFNVSSNIVASQSRTLAAAYSFDTSTLSSDSDGSLSDVTYFLCYEGVIGNMTCMIGLLGSYNDPQRLGFDWIPIQISPDLPGTTPLRNYSGPLNLSLVEANSTEGINSSFMTINYVEYFQNTYRFSGSRLDQSKFTGKEIVTPLTEHPSTSLDIHGTDLTWDGFLIINSTLEDIFGQYPNELQHVPFRRLAGTWPSSPGTNGSYVYRQLDQTTVSEEVFDTGTGYWSSSNFTVST